MSRYCLDTSAYSRFRRGHPEVLSLLDRAEWVGLPSVVLGELHAGFLLGSHTKRNLDELAEFLAHPTVEELVIDGITARRYAELVSGLRQSGRPIPTNDIWIAACAARAGVPVLTFDEHFRYTRGVGSIILT